MTREQLLLVQVAEECSEVAQRCSKAVRFGLQDIQAGQDDNNEKRLYQELNDLFAVLEMVSGCPIESFIDRRQMSDKKARVEEYYRLSESLGMVDASQGEQARMLEKIAPTETEDKSKELLLQFRDYWYGNRSSVTNITNEEIDEFLESYLPTTGDCFNCNGTGKNECTVCGGDGTEEVAKDGPECEFVPSRVEAIGPNYCGKCYHSKQHPIHTRKSA